MSHSMTNAEARTHREVRNSIQSLINSTLQRRYTPKQLEALQLAANIINTVVNGKDA